MSEELEPSAGQLEETETIAATKHSLRPSDKKRHKVQSGMIGLPEIIGLSLGFLVLIATGLFYLFWVVPAESQLKSHRASRDQLENELKTSKNKFGDITTTEGRVAELINSVDFFERNYLPVPGVGKPGLYQRINSLISAYGLTNTTGPDFSPLEISEVKQNQENEKEKGRTKFQSLFPGVYVSMTVEGNYQSLRRFLRELESTNQFVVISTVELEASENSESGEKIQRNIRQGQNAPPGGETYARPETTFPPGLGGNGVQMGQPGQVLNPSQAKPSQEKKAAKGKMHGELVSLHVELAAYFRRNIQAPAPVEAASR